MVGILIVLISLFNASKVEVHAHNKYWVPYIFETIQEAVNYATDGDEIVVAAGTYNGSVVLNKSVALWSYEFQKAVIVGDEYSEAVTIQADNAVLWGFNITSYGVGGTGVALHSCSGVRITGNSVDAGLGVGILVEGGVGNSIVNNAIVSCVYHGIELVGTNSNLVMGNRMNAEGSAILMAGSNSNHVFKNMLLVHFAPTSVLYMSGSNSNVIEENMISLQGGPETPSIQFLGAVQDNTFFHNNFLWVEAPEVYGYCINHSWDNGAEGNYWWDYDGIDSNGDGIGDTPYPILDNFTDSYPLMNPYSWWNIADLNRDWKVDIFDVVQLCGDYGATVLASDWSFLCDIAEPWGAIDIFDLVTIASNYGKIRPST